MLILKEYILGLQWVILHKFSWVEIYIEYHTSILHDEINFDWSKIEFNYQDETIFFPSTMQIPLHGKFKTRKLITCLDSKFTIVIQCQNIVYVLNEHKILQPKLRMLKG